MKFSKNSFILLSIFLSISIASFADETAKSYLSQARNKIRQWQHYRRALSYNANTTYKLYKEVYLNYRSLMTYKDMIQMYRLGISIGEDAQFLKKVKAIIDRDYKVVNKEYKTVYK